MDTNKHELKIDCHSGESRNLETFFTKEEFKIGRTPNEYIKWYYEKLENRDKVLIEAMRFRKGLCKQFIEESLYLKNFLEKYEFNKSGVQLRHIIGNQSFDVEVVYSERDENSDLKFLEITDSVSDQYEYYRMKVLHEQGSVNGFGKVTKTGTKNKGLEITVADEFISDDERFEEMNKVIDALNKKLEKCSNYPEGTGLNIGVDDARLYKDDDIKYIERQIKTYASILTGFSFIFFVGATGNMFLSYDIKALNSKKVA